MTILKADIFYSTFLKREVHLSVFYKNDAVLEEVIIINDGQDLSVMPLEDMLQSHINSKKSNIGIIGCAAAPGDERRQEYGVQWAADYKGRGSKAKDYAQFVLQELLPYIQSHTYTNDKTSYSIAGWSLGGLSAMDIAWHAPTVFSKVGVFSGSLWWRNPDLIKDDAFHRLMHHRVKNSESKPNLKFWFQAGTEDEKADRNNNGIIDAIDDTLDLITELESKGYVQGKDLLFHIEQGGKHDVETWSRMMPLFLDWIMDK